MRQNQPTFSQSAYFSKVIYKQAQDIKMQLRMYSLEWHNLLNLQICYTGICFYLELISSQIQKSLLWGDMLVVY